MDAIRLLDTAEVNRALYDRVLPSHDELWVARSDLG